MEFELGGVSVLCQYEVSAPISKMHVHQLTPLRTPLAKLAANTIRLVTQEQLCSVYN